MNALRVSNLLARQCTYLSPSNRRLYRSSAPQRRGFVRTFCSAGATVDSEIERVLTENGVAVFSKTYCPYCAAVKELFKKLEVEHVVIELDSLDQGDVIQAALRKKTGSRTVPQVFVKGQFLGGCDDTYAAESSGRLKAIFEQAGIKSKL